VKARRQNHGGEGKARRQNHGGEGKARRQNHGGEGKARRQNHGGEGKARRQNLMGFSGLLSHQNEYFSCEMAVAGRGETYPNSVMADNCSGMMASPGAEVIKVSTIELKYNWKKTIIRKPKRSKVIVISPNGK
jgi:hypothetical protein